MPGVEPLQVWRARPEDVIVGKLMAWAEGRSRKHETDIYEMMVFHALGIDPEWSAGFDETLSVTSNIVSLVGLNGTTQIDASMAVLAKLGWRRKG